MSPTRVAVALLFIAVTLPLLTAQASPIEYHLEKEWATLWVNSDGTIDLQYHIEITSDQGEIHYVDVDQPTGDFTIGGAYDPLNRTLRVEDASEGEDYEVRVHLAEPLQTGMTASFTVTTNLGHMIWRDEENPGNVGLQFIPCTWNAEVKDLRVLIHLPRGVDEGEVKNTPDWDNLLADAREGGIALYWERHGLEPNESFTVGVSFPDRYVEAYETQRSGALENLSPLLIFLPFAAIFLLVIGGVVYGLGRRHYEAPRLRIESLGVRRGLTAVEAAHLLGLPPERVVAMILYSLLKKHAVWVKRAKPTVILEIMGEYKDLDGESATQLRSYERDFLKSIRRKGSLDEGRLARAYMNLRGQVENKLRGYCRRDTIAYYRKTVEKAWTLVEEAGAPETASKAYDEHVLWLLLDDRYKERTRGVFEDWDFTPEPWWWWYWYAYTYYHPNPTYTPRGGAGAPPRIPGSELADNIASAVEKTAGNIVSNLEKFADSILPAPPPSKTSREPVHHKSSCACACHACACVCACVSCACACAGGGGVG